VHDKYCKTKENIQQKSVRKNVQIFVQTKIFWQGFFYFSTWLLTHAKYEATPSFFRFLTALASPNLMIFDIYKKVAFFHFFTFPLQLR
jgi:hypothetical protein